MAFNLSELNDEQLEILQQAQIVHQIRDSIITTDLDGNILSWNLGSKVIFGYKEDEVIGKHISLIYLDGNQSIVSKSINFIKKQDRFDSKINLLNKENDILQIEQTLSILKDENNKPIRVIFYFKDISYKERLHSEINKKEKIILEQSQHAAMGEMIGNIAHQWRQPLSIISTAASGMKIEKEYGLLTDEKFNDTCDIIDENSQYLSQTIDDFQNFIKSDSIKKTFNLKKNIDSFLSLVDSIIKTHFIKIILDIPSDLMINSYPNELNQCLINIFNNAKDILSTLEQTDRYIFISASKKDDNISISFKDSGGGIDDEIINKIFQPYFTTKHQSQGTGLGLNIAYNIIVKSLNGNIEVKNSKYIYNNKQYLGAEFSITLPILK
ncbi:MAG: PAS domain-containing sensor histidine kinase [Campylobacterota bacterium]|nr:PAS domain-containing sensor histidine kinase [Campylobacterota bacterium]